MIEIRATIKTKVIYLGSKSIYTDGVSMDIAKFLNSPSSGNFEMQDLKSECVRNLRKV